MLNSLNISFDEIFKHLFDNKINIVYATIINNHNLQNKLDRSNLNLNEKRNCIPKTQLEDRKGETSNFNHSKKIKITIVIIILAMMISKRN